MERVSAFPISYDPQYAMQDGMTLRDWLAGQVVTGFMSEADRPVWADNDHFIAKRAYQLADAMLAAREQKA